MANAVGVALYVVGFGETIQKLISQHGIVMVDPVNDTRIIGIIVVVLLVGVTLIGLEWVVRAQLILLAILLISMVSYFFGSIFGPLDIKADVIKQQGFTGYSKKSFSENFGPSFQGKNNFFTTFSIFFPAATGILAGANISGDLKDPQTAVPKGTLMAIIISTIVYIGFVWMLGGSTAREMIVTLGCTGISSNISVNATCVPSVMKYGLLHDVQVSHLILGCALCSMFFKAFDC